LASGAGGLDWRLVSPALNGGWGCGEHAARRGGAGALLLTWWVENWKTWESKCRPSCPREPTRRDCRQREPADAHAFLHDICPLRNCHAASCRVDSIDIARRHRPQYSDTSSTSNSEARKKKENCPVGCPQTGPRTCLFGFLACSNQKMSNA
jgi:hypothetical protein